ncbi:MAG TPA: histidinol-phosphatase HisJ family protein [Firmicutes bacterium]|nr:histidinol-phosphatase HisJ family protein [Candidatus Fermentithermobacillaceae bacterium]
MNSDFHTHTILSPDSRTPVEEVLKAALDRGLEAVAVTDHAERNPAGFGFFSPYCQSYETYRAAVEHAVARCEIKGKLTVLLGVEIGYTIEEDALARAFLSGCEFDVILGSVHDSYPIDMFRPESGEMLKRDPDLGVETLVRYFTQLEGAASSGLFDVIGHVDLYERYFPGLWPDPFQHPKIAPLARKAVQAIAQKARMEINLDMVNKRGHFSWSALRFLEMYREMGGKPPVAGSDAHRPEYVGLHIAEAERLARQAGFAGLASWEDVVASRRQKGRTVLY